MLNYQDVLINAYRWTAAPARAAISWRLKAQGRLPVSILFYHRVADCHPNSWTISTTRFRNQIEWIEENFELIGLDECQRRIRSGFNDKPALAITFDDGYAENCEFAIPMLLEKRIPFTYFVTLQNVITQQPFRHDIENGQPLPVNSIATIRALTEIGVDIGGHTRTHPDCGQILDEARLHDEIAGSAIELSSLIGQPVRYFAFPFGQPNNLPATGFALAKLHGFSGVCSAYGGANEIGGDEFHLRRFHGDPSLARLKNWLATGRRNAAAVPFESE